eukprot:Hpha_TRINITY_DN26361_c0_g1::TRINITY_DN26361_c0_g1_i1::g.9428::m.9428
MSLYLAEGPGLRSEGVVFADSPHIGAYTKGEELPPPEVSLAHEIPQGRRVATLISGLSPWQGRQEVAALLEKAGGSARPVMVEIYQEAASGKSLGVAVAIWANGSDAEAVAAYFTAQSSPVVAEVCFGQGVDEYTGEGPLPNLGFEGVERTTAVLAKPFIVSVVPPGPSLKSPEAVAPALAEVQDLLRGEDTTTKEERKKKRARQSEGGDGKRRRKEGAERGSDRPRDRDRRKRHE